MTSAGARPVDEHAAPLCADGADPGDAHAFNDGPDLRRRGLWLVLAFLAMATAVFGRLIQIQVIQGKALAAEAASTHTTSITLHATRGVRSSTATAACSSATCRSSTSSPIRRSSARRDRDSVAGMLAADPAGELGADPRARSQQNNQFDYLAKGVSQDVNDKLQALRLSGIGTVPSRGERVRAVARPGSLVRRQPARFRQRGRRRSVRGRGLLQLDPLRRSTGTSRRSPTSTATRSSSGASRRFLPKMAITWSSASTRRSSTTPRSRSPTGSSPTKSTSGTLMVMDTKTGAIRAWAQYPSYNAERLTAPPSIADFRDLAVSQPYEPGSIMKVDHLRRWPQQQRLHAEHRHRREADSASTAILIHDWDGRSHGNVTMQWVLDDSLNNGAIDAGKMEGPERLLLEPARLRHRRPDRRSTWPVRSNDPLPAQSSWNELEVRRGVLRAGPRRHAGRDARRDQRRCQRRRLGAAARRRRDRQPQHRNDDAVRAGHAPGDVGDRGGIRSRT